MVMAQQASKQTKDDNSPICMAEEYWANSQFSVARYYGGMRFNGYNYRIVNKNGVDVFELSAKMGDKNGKVIPDGEPCDLVMVEFIPLYRKVGRDEFIRLLKIAPRGVKAALNFMKDEIKSR